MSPREALRRRLTVRLAVAGLLLVGCSEDYAVVAPHQRDAEVHWVQTADGYQVVLHRYATVDGPPVVLCHGVSSNHHFWDLEPGRSLALDLHGRGYDVWNLDLRGHGRARTDDSGTRQPAGWSIDDYGLHDLPAALRYVADAADAEEVGFVGHSMGGMVLAVTLAHRIEVPLGPVVLVGSPLDFRDTGGLLKTAAELGVFAPPVPFWATPAGAKALAGMHAVPLRLHDLLYAPESIASDAAQRMMSRVVSPLSRGEVAQFLATLRAQDFRSADGTIVYRESLGHVTVPMRFLAGRADRVVNPDRVRGYFEAVGSPERDFYVLSRAHGDHADYGHLDTGTGDHAAVDVFPRIADWLAQHGEAP